MKYCNEAKTQEACIADQPTFRSWHCTWNAKILDQELNGIKWKYYDGMHLSSDQKAKETLENTIVGQCADVCQQMTWCKSFDYYHRYGHKKWQRCFLYDNSANHINSITDKEAMNSTWHFEKIKVTKPEEPAQEETKKPVQPTQPPQGVGAGTSSNSDPTVAPNYYEAPIKTPGQCTHMMASSSDYVVVEFCKQ